LYYLRYFLTNIIAAKSPRKLKFVIYRRLGLDSQSDMINNNCYFVGDLRKIHIGKETFFNHGCFFDADSDDDEGHIYIGNHCSFGYEVMVCTSTHRLNDPWYRTGEAIWKTIRIGNDCWIGARAIILPGVSIEDGCIVAAGSVVTKDCEKDGLYAGVPARRMKDLPPLPTEKL